MTSYDAGEIVNIMANKVNASIDAEEYEIAIQREHNYLQQRLFDKILKQGIIALASQDYYDARNSRAVQQSREICDHMDWDY